MIVQYRGKLYKSVGRRGRRLYLKDVTHKYPRSYKTKFRSYANLKAFGVSKKSKLINSKNRLKLRGGAALPGASGSADAFVTNDDNEWVRKISNPYDRHIADQNLKVLRGLKKFFGLIDPTSSGKDLKISDMINELNTQKRAIVDAALDNIGNSSAQINQRLKNIFKDIGLTLIGKGWIWNAGYTKFESVPERKQQVQAALDEIISEMKTKAQGAVSSLQQLYLRQGDREEGEKLRIKDEERARQLREKEDASNVPKYAYTEYVNPLGYSGRREQRVVDVKNPDEVRRAKTEPTERRFDRGYLAK